MKFRTYRLENWLIPMWCIGAAIQYWFSRTNANFLILLIGVILLLLVAIHSYIQVDSTGISQYCQIFGIKYNKISAEWVDIERYSINNRSLVIFVKSGMEMEYDGISKIDMEIIKNYLNTVNKN